MLDSGIIKICSVAKSFNVGPAMNKWFKWSFEYKTFESAVDTGISA